jgi:hypothetical protein
MDSAPSTYRTDARLRAMLDETGEWVVNDASGLIMGNVLASLREALRAATAFSATGEIVQAVSRLPPNCIIVFGRQVDRMQVSVAAAPIERLPGPGNLRRTSDTDARVLTARVAVTVADPDFSRDLVSRLRREGYLVVEPEIAELKITHGRGLEGVRLYVGNRRGRSAFLHDPVSAYQVIAAARRILPPLIW